MSHPHTFTTQHQPWRGGHRTMFTSSHLSLVEATCILTSLIRFLPFYFSSLSLMNALNHQSTLIQGKTSCKHLERGQGTGCRLYQTQRRRARRASRESVNLTPSMVKGTLRPSGGSGAPDEHGKQPTVRCATVATQLI